MSYSFYTFEGGLGRGFCEVLTMTEPTNLVPRNKMKNMFCWYKLDKKFEFALVNHSFEPIRSEIKFPTYFVPLIWP